MVVVDAYNHDYVAYKQALVGFMSESNRTPAQFRDVRLRPAYAWDCPQCAREVFTRGIVPEMWSEDLQTLRNEFGVDAWEEGDFVVLPDEVECPYCHSHFLPVHYRDEESAA